MGACCQKLPKNKSQKYEKERLFALLNSKQSNRIIKLSVIDGQTFEANQILQEFYQQQSKGFLSSKQCQIQKVLGLLQKIIGTYFQNLTGQNHSYGAEFHGDQFTIIVNKLVIDVYENLRDFSTSEDFVGKRETFNYSAKVIIKKYRITDYYAGFTGPLQHLLNHMSLIFHTLLHYLEDKTQSQIRLETEEEVFCFHLENQLYNELKQDLQVGNGYQK